MREGRALAGSVLLSAKGPKWNDTWDLASFDANERNTTHQQLIVLDLNGTLLHRTQKNNGVRKGYPRPHLGEFLRFALDNFAVMVWSSAQPATIEEMLRKLLQPYCTEFVRVWDRRYCELGGSYFEKATSIKDLQRICDGFGLDQSPYRDTYGKYSGYRGACAEMKGHWTIDNIILVDDTETKAARNKDNHIHVSTFGNPNTPRETRAPTDDELLKLKQYLGGYVEKKASFPSLVAYLKEYPWTEFRDLAAATKGADTLTDTN
ncbi:hypothetical protein LPJ61_003201 [Coemansia biformis]|uniref:Mitochondrial import inner membrane translocase subunit TIM50 n=1 Tax=Coemansia biformis TaxID=1286918 RepID=A0A9W8CVS0_9FUNG|nr:hypothetical protein LPJ61_003201 [Coemansia biformis]